MRQYVLRLAIVLGLIVSAVPALLVSAYSIDEPSFERTWSRTDKPVADGVVHRTWMWGPSGHSEAFIEPYLDAPGGERLVQYSDKSRFEDNSYRADPPWDVTNGRLAYELITGRMQISDADYEEHEPARVHVAGDPHPDTPTYANFNQVLDYDAIPTDWTIIQTIDQDGTVASDETLAQYGVTAAHHVPDTDHTVASVFWEFMNSTGEVYENGQYVEAPLFENPFFAMGFPITEAYWMHVPIDGEWQWLLAQCFERRCATYTPGNDPGWQVEASNIGQHYYEWRYRVIPVERFGGSFTFEGEGSATVAVNERVTLVAHVTRKGEGVEGMEVFFWVEDDNNRIISINPLNAITGPDGIAYTTVTGASAGTQVSRAKITIDRSPPDLPPDPVDIDLGSVEVVVVD